MFLKYPSTQYLSVSVFVCLSLRQSSNLYIYLSVYLSVCLLICLSFYRSLSVDLSIYIYDFLKKNFSIGLYSDIYRPISFSRGMLIETTTLYILIPLWCLDLNSSSNLYEKAKLLCPFSRKFLNQFGWISVCCRSLLVCWSCAEFILHN